MSFVTEAHASVHQKDFTMVKNFLIQKANVSASAAFLLIYLISFPQDWVFHDSAIMERMGCKIDKLRDLFSELRVAGYVKTIAIPGPSGTYVGRKRIFASEPIFFLENQSKKPSNPRPVRVSPKVGFSRTSVKPERREKPTLYTNTKSLDTNTNLSFTNKQEPPVDKSRHKEQICDAVILKIEDLEMSNSTHIYLELKSVLNLSERTIETILKDWEQFEIINALRACKSKYGLNSTTSAKYLMGALRKIKMDREKIA